MSKSYKLKDGNYIDSTGIVHNKQLLSNLLNAKWKKATLNSDYFESGNVRYVQIGNIVIVNIDEVTIKETTQFDNATTVLASGLPTGVISGITLLNQGDGTNSTNAIRVRLLNGNIYLHWTSVTKYSNGGISGSIIACSE